jgi:hypothetical protein
VGGGGARAWRREDCKDRRRQRSCERSMFYPPSTRMIPFGFYTSILNNLNTHLGSTHAKRHSNEGRKGIIYLIFETQKEGTHWLVQISYLYL